MKVTSKAFTSIINTNILEIVTLLRQTVNSSVGRRLKVEYFIASVYPRHVLATSLRNKGIEPEIIDLL